LQPLGVEFEALDEVAFESRGGPLPELRAAVPTDPVADREDRIEAVVVDFARNVAITFGSNYPETPDSCLSLKLTFVVDVSKVLANRAHVSLEQLRHHGLGQP